MDLNLININTEKLDLEFP